MHFFEKLIIILILITTSLHSRVLHVRDSYSHSIKSEDNKFILVLLASKTKNEELKDTSLTHQKTVSHLRTTYQTSGLYRTDDPKKPLWTIDNTLHTNIILRWVSSNGESVVGSNYDGFYFFNKGKLIKKQTVPDRYTGIRQFLPIRVDCNFNDSKGLLEFKTNLGEYYSFSILTGEKVKEAHLARQTLLAIILFTAAIVVYKRKKTRTKRSTE